jgi:hypothetical protein
MDCIIETIECFGLTEKEIMMNNEDLSIEN